MSDLVGNPKDRFSCETAHIPFYNSTSQQKLRVCVGVSMVTTPLPVMWSVPGDPIILAMVKEHVIQWTEPAHVKSRRHQIRNVQLVTSAGRVRIAPLLILDYKVLQDSVLKLSLFIRLRSL